MAKRSFAERVEAVLIEMHELGNAKVSAHDFKHPQIKFGFVVSGDADFTLSAFQARIEQQPEGKPDYEVWNIDICTEKGRPIGRVFVRFGKQQGLIFFDFTGKAIPEDGESEPINRILPFLDN